ncbi:MAG: FtsX-like permease family protein [Saccharospirillaceae bacterium]|nr:FtsX-like permease family protein [Colwellia sp.]NRB77692.1 FtsX-like permease family protein [Saccharospirillaceae bacterium]
MIGNYLVSAMRAIRKDKPHFFLNLIGFSVGIAAAILMALFAQYELSYDNQHPDSERVYRAHGDFTSWGLELTGTSSYKVAVEMAKHADVEGVFRLINTNRFWNHEEDAINLVQNKESRYNLNNFYAASENILAFIALEVLDGDIKKSLQQPNQLAISESEALRLFGSVQVVGQTLNFKAGQYRIGAVFKDLPENTHFKFDTLIQIPPAYGDELWGFNYYKLLAQADIPRLTKAMTDHLHIIYPAEKWQQVTMSLVNLEQLHFNTKGRYEMKTGGSLTTLQICIALSVILVLIASINFINLTIAQSARRAKEVGVRKTLGATKGQLVAQFLTESLIVVVLAGLLALTMVELGLQQFNQLMDSQLTLSYSSPFMLTTILVIFGVGILSGLYPAIFIASFSAKRVLSGDLVYGSSAIFFRKMTLCLQGAFSVGLIIGASSLYQQMELVNNLAVGYEKKSRLIIKNLPTQSIFKRDNNTLLERLRRLDGVVQVSLSGTDITNGFRDSFNFTWPNGETLEGIQPNIATGFYGAEVLGLKLLAGRDFSPKFSNDWLRTDAQGNRTFAVLVSRRMVELAGYSDINSVLGMQLYAPDRKLTANIVGVIENVKLGSARQQAMPVSVGLGSNFVPFGHIVLKVSTSNMYALNKQILAVIEQELHLSDVTISLISDDYKAVHKSEHRAFDMVTTFSLLAIFLTCLGILGLASFATIRRQKEVAMRKVLGASRLSIVNLLAKEFLFLMVVSLAIAYPITFWLVNDWLANFNERIEQAAWVYIAAALTITILTWLTVASLAFKAASKRPSLTLRDE